MQTLVRILRLKERETLRYSRAHTDTDRYDRDIDHVYEQLLEHRREIQFILPDGIPIKPRASKTTLVNQVMRAIGFEPRRSNGGLVYTYEYVGIK